MSNGDLEQIGPYKVGEIPPPIVVLFTDSNNNPIDLTGFTGKWVERPTNAPLPAETVRAAVVNPDQVTHKGEVTYTWIAGDFTTVGEWQGEMWAGNGAQRYASKTYGWRTRSSIWTAPNI